MVKQAKALLVILLRVILWKMVRSSAHYMLFVWQIHLFIHF